MREMEQEEAEGPPAQHFDWFLPELTRRQWEMLYWYSAFKGQEECLTEQ